MFKRTVPSNELLEDPKKLRERLKGKRVKIPGTRIELTLPWTKLDPNTRVKNEEGEDVPLLLKAIQEENKWAAEMLLEYGAKMEGAMIREAIERMPHLVYPYLDELEGKERFLALYKAASRARWKIFEYLLERATPEELHMKTSNRRTLFHVITEARHLKPVLEKAGPLVIADKKHHHTPFHRLARYGSYNALRLFMDYTTERIEERDDKGNTALHMAAHSLKKVRLLADYMDVNAVNNEGQTFLHIAGKRGAANVFGWAVLNAPHLLYVKDMHGKTPIEYAPERVWKEVGMVPEEYLKTLTV